MINQNKTVRAVAALTLGITVYSVWKLIGTGILSWHVAQPEFLSMAAELVVVWVLLFMSLFFAKNRWIAWCSIAAIAGFFSWMHVIFLPIISTALYTGYLILVGKWFCKRVLKQEWGPCWEYLMGCALTVTVFCAMSAVQMGSITKLRIWVAASSSALLLGFGIFYRKTICSLLTVQGKCNSDTGKCFGFSHSVLLASILTLVFLQAGRMNVAIDFDSIWYGLRSNTMLNSGNGIYEDLKTLGVAYTYSKGWETLCLPFAGLPSYGFTIGMSLWTAVLILYAVYETAAEYMKREDAILAPFLIASIPGIMNMADSAKPDLITLLCQLLLIQGVIRFIKVRQVYWLIAALAAGIVSLIMKPTALIFSGTVVGITILWILWQRKKIEWKLIGTDRQVLYMLIPAVTALMGIWIRTLKLTGIPLTSIFTQFFQILGFKVKYPFCATSFFSESGRTGLGDTIKLLMKRLYGLTINPQGEDMAHVIIAWGGLLPITFLILRLSLRNTELKRTDKQSPARLSEIYLNLLLTALFFVNLASLYFLAQIDGNYYILFYVLVVLAGLSWIARFKKRELLKTALILLLPAWCCGALLCGLTNGAWALGNGGIQMYNKGYYPHLQEARMQRSIQGSQNIWDLLASNPKNRVIALGNLPDVLTFPCWVQSYVDLSRYWGNPQVVANAKNFEQYLMFADVDYLYLEKEYMNTNTRIYWIIRTLIQEGRLYDVREEYGNLIIRVQKGEKQHDMVRQNLDIFDNRYIQHP